MISLPTGSVTSISFRLCVRAPRTTMSEAFPEAGTASGSTVKFPGARVNQHRSAAGSPQATGRVNGPRINTWSVRRDHASSRLFRREPGCRRRDSGAPALIHRQHPLPGRDVLAQDVNVALVAAQLEVAMVGREP